MCLAGIEPDIPGNEETSKMWILTMLNRRKCETDHGLYSQTWVSLILWHLLSDLVKQCRDLSSEFEYWFNENGSCIANSTAFQKMGHPLARLRGQSLSYNNGWTLKTFLGPERNWWKSRMSGTLPTHSSFSKGIPSQTCGSWVPFYWCNYL